MKRRLAASLVRLATGARPLAACPHGDGPAIFYANHSSHMDFLVVWAALPDAIRDRARPVAAEDYWGVGRLRRRLACDLFRAILVPRGGTTRQNHPIDRLGEALVEGSSLILFPEGTRRTDGETGPFKSGIYHLARRHPEIPLVPVHLENLNRILPKGSHLPVPLIVHVRFGTPLRILPREPKPAFLERAHAALLATSHDADP
jgi:1-acyl-sn-glycerol-3-phosphate acyltransferase